MYVGWRDLVQAKGRFALMAGVVMLIAVLIGLLSGLTRGLADESTSAITGLRTERLVFSGSEPDFATSRIVLDDAPAGTPLGVAAGRVSTDQHTEPATLMGVPAGSSLAPDAQDVASGAVVLSEPIASEFGLAAGDRVRLGSKNLAVAAVRGNASYSHLPVVWLELSDWQAVTGARGTATVVATSTHDAPPGHTNVSLPDSLAGIGAYTSENRSLQLIRGFLFAISALVVGAFFTVWTIQRARDLAVLKALGASTSFLLRDALGQALLLLLAGIGPGALVVLLVGNAAADVVPFVLDVSTLGGPLLALLGLGLAGAGLAVRRITSVDPLTALGAAR